MHKPNIHIGNMNSDLDSALEFMNGPLQGKTVLQIVPRRTSAPDGIGDYAISLARGLMARYCVKTAFLCGTPSGVYPPADDDWPVFSVKQRSSSDFLQTLRQVCDVEKPAAVVLHVGGYGYARRGAPLWLWHGLRRWRKGASTVRLVAVFHELYAKGRPWNSSFWLSGLQREVARGIWHLANFAITTNTRYMNELASWRPEAADRIALMPVVSNVGELPVTPNSAGRKPRAIAFGSAGLEKLLYVSQRSELESFLRISGVKEIVDIGIRHGPVPEQIGSARVVCLGQQAATAISKELQESRYGLMVYDIDRLGKSSVFAAYASHGVVPVCLGSSATALDGLESGWHFLRYPFADETLDKLTQISQSVQNWYADHRIERLIDCLACLCFGHPNTPSVLPAEFSRPSQCNE